MQLCIHCVLVAWCFALSASPLPIIMTVKLQPSQEGVQYFLAEKSTIKCLSMKSGVFLIFLQPLKEVVQCKCSTFAQIVAQLRGPN